MSKHQYKVGWQKIRKVKKVKSENVKKFFVTRLLKLFS